MIVPGILSRLIARSHHAPVQWRRLYVPAALSRSLEGVRRYVYGADEVAIGVREQDVMTERSHLDHHLHVCDCV